MDTDVTARHLSRSAGDGRPAAPIRIVHVGLGNFSRAHLAWYTEHAPDADQWGIAAFTGRSTALADAMAPQDGLYTLVTRAPDGDRYEVVSSISRVHPSSDHAAWLDYLSSPDVAVVTLTVTEAGYLRGAEGGIDTDDLRVRDDVAALRRDPTSPIVTAPGRLVAGFLARRAAGAGPVAVVALDNLPDNGAVVARVVTGLAALVDPTLTGWMADHVSWVTTMVDRITPAPTADDRAGVLAGTGATDPAAVVTEPFAEWVLSGSFPSGRPAWDLAGAQLVEHIEPSEERKLWLLNGAHSLLAYGASIRGHETVADAVADPVCRGWVEQWWDEASRHLRVPGGEVSAYRAALLERFENPRMRDLLARIAADGSQKLPVRIVPVLRRQRAAGRPATGAAQAVAAWVLHLRGRGAPVKDPGADELSTRVGGTLDDAVSRVLAFLGIADDKELHQQVLALATELGGAR